MIYSKFSNVPTDPDSRTTYSKVLKIGKYDALHQKWNWDGIRAESFIFANADIAGMTDEELKKLVRSSPLVKDESDFTLQRMRSGYTFVNFNFEVT